MFTARTLIWLALCLASAAFASASVPELVGKLALAIEPEVASQLGLTSAEREKLQELIDDRTNAGLNDLLRVKDLPKAEQIEKLAPFREKSEELGRSLMNADQWRMLQQIAWRRRGLESLKEPGIDAQLKLSDQQKSSLQQILESLPNVEGEEKLAQAKRELPKLLSDEQYKAWQKLVGLAQEATPMQSDSPAASRPPATDPNTATLKLPTKPDDAKLRFNFRYQPWGEVLDWFAQQADLSLVMDAPPQGTFNYTDNRTYSPPEAIDLLNSVLLTKGYTLVRRERMLMVVNLEDGIPPNLVPFVPLSELDEKGEFELVKVLFPLRKLTPEEAQAEVQAIIGPQGAIVALNNAQQLLVTETAGRLRVIRNVLDAVENPGGSGEIKVLETQYALPGEVMNMIRQLLDIPADRNATEDGSLRVAVDEVGGKLLISGRPDMTARVQEILKVVDQPGDDANAAGPLEQPQLEVYTVANADPEAVLQVMQTLLAGLPDVRLASDPQTGNLVALARPGEHATIKATLDQMQRDQSQIEVVQLQYVDPQVAVLAINKLFGGTGEEGGNSRAPKVDADPTTGQLLLRGSESQIAQVRLLLEKMGETGEVVPGSGLASGGGPVRMIPLTGNSARTALQQAEAIWPTLRRNKIRIVKPGEMSPAIDSLPSEFDSLIPPAIRTAPGFDGRPKTKDQQPATDDTTNREDAESNRVAIHRTRPGDNQLRPVSYPIRFAVGQQSEETTKGSPDESSEKDKEPSPILIAPAPNGIIIASEDTAALDEFEALLETLTNSELASGREYTIFYLQSTNAVVIAQTLEQIINGTTSDDAGGGGGGSLLDDMASAALGDIGGGLMGGLLGLGGGGGGLLPTSGTLQIVPETRLNALIVQGSPSDIDTIEQLLEVLDQPEPPENRVESKPYLIPVKNMAATELSTILKQVYADRISGASSGQRQQPSPEEFINLLRGRRGNSQRQNTEAQQLKMSIGVDNRTNSLVVVAPEPLYQEVRALVETLDTATSETTDVVQVVTLKGANSASVQAALEALVGEKITTTNSATENSNSPNSSQQRGSSRSSNDSSDQQRQAEDFRRRIEFFNNLRRGMQQGGSRGGAPPGGGRGSRGGR